MNLITFFIFLISIIKINYGKLLLEALLEYWNPAHSIPSNDIENDMRGNGYFQVPEHTPLIVR